MNVEVMAIKIIHKFKTKVHPLSISSIEYDEQKEIHDTKSKIKTITNALKGYKVLPNAEALGNDEDEVVFVLSSIISDAAYKAALDDNGNPLCDTLIRKELDLSPLYQGWETDENHVIEAVRKAINKECPDLAVFVQAINQGFDVLMRPKWWKMMKNLMKNNQKHNVKKWLKLSTTRFWRFYAKSLERVHYNLPGAFTVFRIIHKQGGKLGRSSIGWREKWASMQFLSFLCLQIDINKPINRLVSQAQEAKNAYPYYKTNYLLVCRQQTSEKLKALKACKKILVTYNTNQFNPSFNIHAELTKQHVGKYLPYFVDNLDDMLAFEYAGWDLTEFNMFSNFTENISQNPDASQRLTEEQYVQAFGSEASTSPEEVHDSDYEQEEEMEVDDVNDIDTEQEAMEVDELLVMEPVRDRNQKKYSWTREEDCDYVDGCELIHDKDKNCTGWVCCTGCEGWMCSMCIMDKYGFELNTQSMEIVNCIDWNCNNCMKSLIDCVDIMTNYTQNWYDSYYGEEGRHCMDELTDSFDAKWFGLSIDRIVDKCQDFGFDDDDITKYMIDSVPYIMEGANEFNRMYADLWGECDKTKWSMLFGCNNTQMRTLFIKTKKEMIRCCLSRYSRIKRNDEEFLSDKQIKKLKYDVFCIMNEQINKNKTYSDMRFLWNLAVSKMGSECIVESINSHLTRIYDDYRQSMDVGPLLNLLQSKLLLPTEENQKDIVVGAVNDEYRDNFDVHDDHHIGDRAKRYRNQGLKQINISESIDKFNGGKCGPFELDFED